MPAKAACYSFCPSSAGASLLSDLLRLQGMWQRLLEFIRFAVVFHDEVVHEFDAADIELSFYPLLLKDDFHVAGLHPHSYAP